MFPYIKQIKVNDCYTWQNFTVLDRTPDTFKHIILTGKNGSGKTTILNNINNLLLLAKNGSELSVQLTSIENRLSKTGNVKDRQTYNEQLKQYKDIELEFFEVTRAQAQQSKFQGYEYLIHNKDSWIHSFFRATRGVKLQDVQQVTNESEFLKKLRQSIPSENFAQQFKQFLINKKVYEAFEYMSSDEGSANKSSIFFIKLTEILSRIFNDKDLKIEFDQTNFEIYLVLSNGQKVTFNQLSAGFSAYLAIMMDILMKTDLIRKETGNFKDDPAGIVLIDEPETHLHIEMQYEILPLLNSLFPNIQFIIATHSPAVISSLEDAMIFDLSTQTNVENGILGSSYSELMISHFGLVNEFGPKADELITAFEEAHGQQNIEKMKRLLEENHRILTPSLRLALESRIIEIESYKNDD